MNLVIFCLSALSMLASVLGAVFELWVLILIAAYCFTASCIIYYDQYIDPVEPLD